MKRIDFRIAAGGALILLGFLMLLERAGLFHGAADFFWGLLTLAGGAFFLYRFMQNPRGEWWAAIPGFALAGMAADSLLPGIVGQWSGLFFLGFIGAGFFAVYFSDRERWWALIPGGVLLTLGITSVLNDVYNVPGSGGFFFLGLGLTFLLVAVLASQQWAYVPGVVLLVMGVLIGSPFSGAMNFVWPAALILAGLLLIMQFMRRK